MVNQLYQIHCFTRKVTDGSIEIEGKDISDLTDNELSKFRGEKIGFIFQSFSPAWINAQENVEKLLYHDFKVKRLESRRRFRTSRAR